ncbi:MAG: GMC family oxidoreductase [Deltaproteobacteria bacterium]|nr:MAG: GMC family oxidoreductase [Deltaproteobacteria bacterium]
MATKRAIVIGSGAGGSMAARALARSGKFKVTIFEKGTNYFTNLTHPDVSQVKTRFSNDELKFGTRSWISPDPLVDPRSFRTSTSVDREFVGEVNTLPQTVGGGLNHADWKARRFRRADFRLADIAAATGTDISGSSVQNWPIGYDDLEKFYTAVEYVVGVQGPGAAQMSAGAAALFSPRSTPFPMPPGVPQYVALRLGSAATTLGLHPVPAPMGITSQIYRGRAACNDCGFDGNFGCPINAKGSPAVTSLRDALLAGATLRPDCYVDHLKLGPYNRIESVDYFDENGAPQTMDVGPKGVVILAASAIEDARLCLNSGLGALNDNIGRHLMFHYQTTVVGVFPERLHPHRGRPITHMIDDLCGPAELADYSPTTPPRGGTIELGGSQNLIDEGKNIPISGTAHKQLMRQSPTRDHLAAMTMQGEDLPQAGNRVDLDPGLRDIHGIPVARVTYANHSFELAAAQYYTPMLLDILRVAGATFTAPLGGDAPRGLLPPELEGNAQNPTANLVPGSRHLLGGLRMGDDPANDQSVTDSHGKFHDFDNLYAADGSLFVTSTGMNPSLTIMALGHRVGCSILNRLDPEAARQQIDGDLFA